MFHTHASKCLIKCLLGVVLLLSGLSAHGAAKRFDFDGDGKADIAVHDPASSTWYIMRSRDGFLQQSFGWSATKPVPADYDGDGKIDIAVYDPATGDWYIQQSRDGFVKINFGWDEADPVPADYDGDGKADLAVYYQAQGEWYIQKSRDGFAFQKWGWNETDPVPADYDGDGKADIAVYHQPTMKWSILQSSNNTLRESVYGYADAKPLPADYNGDGKADLALYHQAAGNWYISGNQVRNYGWSDAKPTPADYNGDGRVELGVYHQAAGNWYLEGQAVKNFGWSAANPISIARDRKIVPAPVDPEWKSKTAKGMFFYSAPSYYWSDKNALVARITCNYIKAVGLNGPSFELGGRMKDPVDVETRYSTNIDKFERWIKVCREKGLIAHVSFLNSGANSANNRSYTYWYNTAKGFIQKYGPNNIIILALSENSGQIDSSARQAIEAGLQAAGFPKNQMINYGDDLGSDPANPYGYREKHPENLSKISNPDPFGPKTLYISDNNLLLEQMYGSDFKEHPSLNSKAIEDYTKAVKASGASGGIYSFSRDFEWNEALRVGGIWRAP